MKVRRLAWLGIATPEYDQMVGLLRDVELASRRDD
jgi:hypothetical protein